MLRHFFRAHLAEHITEEIQAWMILLGVSGMFAAPFLPTGIGVIVINEASMLALTITGMAGLDAARGGKNGERH